MKLYEFIGNDTGKPLLVREDLVMSVQFALPCNDSHCDNPSHSKEGCFAIHLVNGYYLAVKNSFEEIKEILGVEKESWQ